MFAVSENICIFVMPRIAYFTDSRITYKESVYSAGSLSDNSISVGLRFLAEHSERARPFSFIYTVINFFQKMPRIEKVSSTKVNNSNLSAQPIHKFRVKYEATGKVLKELSKLMPAGDVPLSNMFGTKSCVQLD